MKYDIVIRTASDVDHQEILTFERRLLGRPIPTSATEAVFRDEIRVAMDGDRLVGFAIFNTLFFGQTFIELLAVDPAYRRQGIASTLIDRIEADAGTEKIFTSTNESNAPMHQVLAGLGYVRSGQIDNLDEGDPEIVYFKRTTGANGRRHA